MEAKRISSLSRRLVLFIFFAFSLTSFAQMQYTVNEESVLLFVEEEGELTLLSERSAKTYRFFLKKGVRLEELTEENYKSIIEDFTADVTLDTENLKFNRKAIAEVVYQYNLGGEDAQGGDSTVSLRLGAFGGLSNFTGFANPQNENLFFAGLEAEVYSETDYTRNSIIAQLRKSFPTDEFDLDITELMIGYRFKVIDIEIFHFYLEAELFRFGTYQESFTELDSNNEIIAFDRSSTSLNAPIGLGAGMALRLFNENYLTLGYSNLVKIGESTRSDFPVDVRLGLKFRL
jgi:hypothetical protein